MPTALGQTETTIRGLFLHETSIPQRVTIGPLWKRLVLLLAISYAIWFYVG
jgi:hypothetical protein